VATTLTRSLGRIAARTLSLVWGYSLENSVTLRRHYRLISGDNRLGLLDRMGADIDRVVNNARNTFGHITSDDIGSVLDGGPRSMSKPLVRRRD